MNHEEIEKACHRHFGLENMPEDKWPEYYSNWVIAFASGARWMESQERKRAEGLAEALEECMVDLTWLYEGPIGRSPKFMKQKDLLNYCRDRLSQYRSKDE